MKCADLANNMNEKRRQLKRRSNLPPVRIISVDNFQNFTHSER